MTSPKPITVILDGDSFRRCIHSDEELSWMIKNTSPSDSLLPHGILTPKQFDELI
jgi:hypothetical protein